MREQPRQYSQEVFVSLSDLATNLENLRENTRCTVRHEGKFVASVVLGKAGYDHPAHFVIRPEGCDSARLAKMDAQFVLEIPQDGRTIAIDPKGAGGHYVPGVRVSIAGHEVTLPVPRSSAHETAVADDFSKFSLSDNSVLMNSLRAKVISGSEKTEHLNNESTLGTAAGVIGIGKRSSNEDHIGAVLSDEHSATLFALDGNHEAMSDGMGKTATGIISAMILDGLQAGYGGIQTFIEIPERFTEMAKARCGQQMHNMGACGIVADIIAGTVTFAHIGDCKGLLLRPGNWGWLEVIHETHDHSVAQEMRDLHMREEQISGDARRIITRSIKAREPYQEISQAEVSDPIALKPGDVIVLMTDGMHLLGLKAIRDDCRWKRGADDIVKRITKGMERALAGVQEADNFGLIAFKYQG